MEDAARVGARDERLELGAAADAFELRVGKAAQHLGRRVDQHVVPFLTPQVRDDDYLAQPRGARSRLEVLDIEPVRHDGDFSRRDPLGAQAIGGGAGVRDDLVREAVRHALHRDLRDRFVRVDLTPVADAHRHPGERCTRQSEDVRVELGGMDERDPLRPTPRRKCPQMTQRGGRTEAGHREDGDGCGGFARAFEPGAAGVEAGDVHFPAPGVEAPDQLDHLTLGATRIEAGHQKGDRQSTTQRHVRHLSKASASRVQKKPPFLPSARPRGRAGGNRGCGQWKSLIHVLLMPPLEDDELPETQRVVALAREVLVHELPHEQRLEVAALEARRRQQRVGEELPEISAEPRAKRYAEPLLAPIQNLGRQQRRRDFLQHVLAAAILDLQRRRQRRRELDDVVVEQRDARLDRVRHAHAIDFREHVFGKIRVGVEAHHLTRPRQMRVALEVRREPRLGIGILEVTKQLAAEQRRLLVGAEEADGVEIPSLFVACDVAQKILAAHAVRQLRGGNRRHAPEGTRAVAIEGDDARVGNVAIVAAEQLVAAVAREYDGDVLARHLGDVPRRDGG